LIKDIVWRTPSSIEVGTNDFLLSPWCLLDRLIISSSFDRVGNEGRGRNVAGLSTRHDFVKESIEYASAIISIVLLLWQDVEGGVCAFIDRLSSRDGVFATVDYLEQEVDVSLHLLVPT